MHTIVADDKKRVRIPDIKPGQVFAYEHDGKTITLTEVVKKEAKEPFPRGSLLKYLTPKRNREQLALQSGCSLEVPE
jgi:hypothetical protein